MINLSGNNKKEITVLTLIGALFLASLFLSEKYSDELRVIMSTRTGAGAVIYFIVSAFAVVVAPISALPLLPIASALYGAAAAALISVLSWATGATAAFLLARRYGKKIISKYVNLKHIERMERAMPSKQVFWGIVFLRLTLPVDIASYALGLFTNVSTRTFILATVLGVSPFAAIFSYAVELPVWFKILSVAAGLAFAYWGYKYVKKFNRSAGN